MLLVLSCYKIKPNKLGKLLLAITMMTPPVRRHLFRALAGEIETFTQAQALNIVDLVKVSGSNPEPVLDMRVWGQYKGPGL